MTHIDNRSGLIRKLDLESSDNNKNILKICALLRDNHDLKEFLLANKPEARNIIYRYLYRPLNGKFFVKPYWELMDLPKPEETIQ